MENTRFESHRLYGDLVAKNRELDYVHDLKGILISINPMAAQSLGFEPEELLGKEMSNLLHTAYRHLFAGYLHRIAKEKKEIGFFHALTRNGEERIWVYYNSLVEEAGKPPLVKGYAQDITEFKKFESLNKGLASLIEATSDFAAIFALDGRVLYANAAFRNLLGFTGEQEIPDSKVNDTNFPWAADLLRNEGIPAAIENGIWRGETALLDKDGVEIPVSQVIIAHTSKEGVVEFFSTLARDISEPKLEQQELRLAKEAAEAASVTKSQFLAVMSHEIRTPLNAIIGMTDLALNTQLAADQLEFFKSIQVNSESLLYLINDILDFSKIEAGQIDIADVPFKLAECVEAVVELLNMRIGTKPLELVCEIAENLPLCVSGDANRLRQILVNLLGNAIRFTQRGKVVIKVEAAPSSDGKTVDLHCSISDTGIGIAKDKQAKIFDKFYQVDDSTTRQYGGSGIGLSISKLLVELMQGEIWLDSQPGRGSTFQIRLPFKIVEPATTQQFGDASATDNPSVEIAKPAEDNKPRILVAEDNKDNQNLAKRILVGAGFAVEIAENGEIAVQKARDYLYDLILMDIQMPLMDGLLAAQEIRKLEREQGDRRVPIIALTAYAIEAYRDKCIESGMNDYLTKPIKKERLLESVNQWIDKRPAILIVDDSAPSQHLIKAYLKGSDYQLFFASNGQQALDFFDQHWVSLVLLDMEMPILDGYATAKAIRQLPIGANLPIIAMTGHEGIEETNKCLSSGCSDYLGKPLKKAKMLEAIRQNLRVKKTAEGSQTQSANPAPSNGFQENQAQEILVYVEEEIEDLVPDFLAGRHEDVKLIKAAIEHHDFVNVQRLGHDLRGCGEGYGFAEISLIGKHLEATAKAKNGAEVLHWNERLEKYLAVIKVVIKRESL